MSPVLFLLKGLKITPYAFQDALEVKSVPTEVRFLLSVCDSMFFWNVSDFFFFFPVRTFRIFIVYYQMWGDRTHLDVVAW